MENSPAFQRRAIRLNAQVPTGRLLRPLFVESPRVTTSSTTTTASVGQRCPSAPWWRFGRRMIFRIPIVGPRGALRTTPPYLDPHHAIAQRPDPADPDLDLVPCPQGEIIRRHDPGAGEEHRAVRKLLTAEEKLRQLA